VAYDTVQEKAADQLLDSHGYSGGTLRVTPEGNLSVKARRPLLRTKGESFLVALIDPTGQVLQLEEFDV
jgi:hypothetical protein